MENNGRNSKEKGGKLSALGKLMEFDIKLNKEQLLKLVPLILFLTTLTMLYIANRYYAEKKLLQVSNLTNEINDLRSDYLTRKSEYMNKTKLSEVTKKTEASGLKELTVPQRKIVVKEGEY